ncbi:ATP-binding protein [Macrococcus bovicus]|uniref:ATP-binding protein n=1 Tax=Macrococcus bovicus TaxID=69968 RepID=UPI0025A4D950|nr:ATP-binding protein [Macrococcus bovicus]WJP97391.1 ATP-binding protein [Macrococcus bovicus]
MKIDFPFENSRFLGYISHINPQYCKVHFPSSTLLNKNIYSGEEFNGGLIGNFISIEAENYGFIGRISEIDLPEKERLALTEKSFRLFDFHPTAKIEILFAFDYYNEELIQSIATQPNIGSKVFACSNEFIKKFISNFGVKNDEDLKINLGHLTSSAGTNVMVSQQSIFNRHCAIVGTTGGGKSWTVTKLIESVKTNNSKAILIDATGEYANQKAKVKSLILGEDTYFPYQKMTKQDFHYLVKPSEGVQVPKLAEAIKSLKMVRKYYENIENKVNSQKKYHEDFKKFIVHDGLIDKSEKSNIEFNRFYLMHYEEIENDDFNLDIQLIAKQISYECIYPTNRDKADLFGSENSNDKNFCYPMISRINHIINSKMYNSIFNFNNNECNSSNNLIAEIEEFIKDEQSEYKILRIGFEKVSYDFQVREILANIIGRYLLNKARSYYFKENPLILFIDEAHQFLKKDSNLDYFYAAKLDAFDQIAKESRKNGLFLCLSTQMPRDIPVGTLSQIGTFIVHRLINFNDKEAIRQASSTASNDLLTYLPNLGEGEAILTGVDFKIPLILKIHSPKVPPDSSTPKFKNKS